MDVVDTTWPAVPSQGNLFVVLHNKLKATANVLVKWSARWIGSIKFQILVAIEVIYRLDIAMESGIYPSKKLHCRRHWSASCSVLAP